MENEMEKSALGPLEFIEKKQKTPRRMRFEAEANLIAKQMGGLSGVLTKLGLRPADLARLLMIDASAIHRWQRDESKIPPHVWRSLSWYLLLSEKTPGMVPQMWLHTPIKAVEENLRQEINQLREELLRLQAEKKKRGGRDSRSLAQSSGNKKRGAMTTSWLTRLFRTRD